MRILFITHKFYPDIGGIEVNSEILALAFHKAGHDVRLVTWTGASGERSFPFPVIRNPDTKVLLKEHRLADVVFENNPSLRLAWPAIFFKKPSVIAIRTWINRHGGKIGWQDRLKLWWLKQATAVIAVSDAVRKRCWPDAIVIGNPYRESLFRTLPENERNIDFVFMGRLVSDKGADIAIKSLKELSNISSKAIDGHSFKLTVVGDGPELQVLQKMVTELDMTSQVTFTGALRGEELVSCLNKHKYLLVPSLWEEPFGNVALEGMACGCIPIVSDGGGLPDAVGKAGLVVKRGEVNALTSGIKSILENPALELQLRNEAKAHLQMHHPDFVSKKYLEVIEQALSNRKN